MSRTKIAILGFTSHNYEAPWGNPEWDFLGLNDLHGTIEQFWPEAFQGDQLTWFQLHHRGPTGEYPGARDPQHTQWLATTKCPVVMWAHDPAIPTSVPYPLDAVLTEPLLPTGEPLSPETYFNNTISWMLAYAIHRLLPMLRAGEPCEIGLFGVDMAMDGVHGQSEYAHQRPSVEYFIGVARALGIRVIIPQVSELLKCAYLYGLDNKMHFRAKMERRHEELGIAEQQCVDTYESVKRALFQTLGGIQVLQGLQGNPVLDALRATIPADVLKPALEALRQDEATLTTELEGAKRSLHETRGAKQNTAWALRNYFPGEGPTQEVRRSETSVVRVPELPAVPVVAQSDGTRKRKATNRVAAALGGH